MVQAFLLKYQEVIVYFLWQLLLTIKLLYNPAFYAPDLDSDLAYAPDFGSDLRSMWKH